MIPFALRGTPLADTDRARQILIQHHFFEGVNRV